MDAEYFTTFGSVRIFELYNIFYCGTCGRCRFLTQVKWLNLGFVTQKTPEIPSHSRTRGSYRATHMNVSCTLENVSAFGVTSSFSDLR